jgi:hypothetical protein
MKNISRNEILAVYRASLPYGARIKIAEKAGVSITAVHSFFSGRIKSERIEKTVLEYIAELRKERERLMKEAGLL